MQESEFQACKQFDGVQVTAKLFGLNQGHGNKAQNIENIYEIYVGQDTLRPQLSYLLQPLRWFVP